MRTVPEWRGRTDDDPVPDRVKLRVFLNGGGICKGCKRKLYPHDRKVCDHIVALVNGGENREMNLQTLGGCCEPKKTAADVAEKSLIYQKQLKHYGYKKPKGRPLPGTRASGIRKRMDGSVGRW